jgi:hypothetical protein
MKPVKYTLILHRSFKQHDMGEFESITAAKKYVSECWDRPYSIKPINPKLVARILPKL